MTIGTTGAAWLAGFESAARAGEVVPLCAPDGWVLDLQQGSLSLGRQLRELHGMAEGERASSRMLKGRIVDLGQIARMLLEVAASGKLLDLDVRLRVPEGVVRVRCETCAIIERGDIRWLYGRVVRQ